MAVRKKATIHDICVQLGLSKATVSKALNGYTEISEKTREKVLNCAQEIGYKRYVKDSARSGNASMRRIGIPNLKKTEYSTNFNSFFLVISGFQHESAKYNMEIILIPNIIPLESQKETPLKKLIAAYQLDGILISSLRIADPYMQQLADISIPAVLWDLRADEPNKHIGIIRYDSLYGARIATEHLLSLGHRRIAFINGHRYASVCYERLDGYRLALAGAGIAPDPSLEYWGDFDPVRLTEEQQAIDALLEKGVTAFFCVSDPVALRVIRHLKTKGLKVPRDISVVGYDNSPTATDSSPTLTTVSQDFFHIGQVACGMMTALLEGLPLHCESLLPPLVVRYSTGPVAKPSPKR